MCLQLIVRNYQNRYCWLCNVSNINVTVTVEPNSWVNIVIFNSDKHWIVTDYELKLHTVVHITMLEISIAAVQTVVRDKIILQYVIFNYYCYITFITLHTPVDVALNSDANFPHSFSLHLLDMASVFLLSIISLYFTHNSVSNNFSQFVKLLLLTRLPASMFIDRLPI